MIPKFIRHLFDSRPICHITNINPKPPASWTFGGWQDWGGGEITFDGYIHAVHRTTKKYCGADLHFVIATVQKPIGPDWKYDFLETKFEGLTCQFWHEKGVYYKLVHVLHDQHDHGNLEIILRAAHDAGSRMQFAGLASKINFLDDDGKIITDPEINKEMWQGWDHSNSCPIVLIESVKHVPHQIEEHDYQL